MRSRFYLQKRKLILLSYFLLLITKYLHFNVLTENFIIMPDLTLYAKAVTVCYIRKYYTNLSWWMSVLLISSSDSYHLDALSLPMIIQNSERNITISMYVSCSLELLPYPSNPRLALKLMVVLLCLSANIQVNCCSRSHTMLEEVMSNKVSFYDAGIHQIQDTSFMSVYVLDEAIKDIWALLVYMYGRSCKRSSS